MKIDWLISGTTSKWIEDNYQSGGRVYDSYARNILRKYHDVKVLYLNRGNGKNILNRTLQFIKYIIVSQFVNWEGELVVRDVYSTIFCPFDKKRKHAIIMHHLDVSEFSPHWFYRLFEKIFYNRAQLADLVITVSDYWKKKLLESGCRNVKIVYNSFDLSQFEFNQEELNEFKIKYGFRNNKPIIYLGNARVEKGFLDVVDALKELEAELIVTGKRKTTEQVRTLSLSYRDYLKLLTVSDLVITMSRFLEGWNRVAHEAMICGTPVIGSGKGGMRELLENGGQMVCSDLKELKSLVDLILSDNDRSQRLSSEGRAYARKFDLEYFEKNWKNIINSFDKAGSSK